MKPDNRIDRSSQKREKGTPFRILKRCVERIASGFGTAYLSLFSEDPWRIIILKIKNRGAIEVIAGSMFSGKTEELIRLIRRAQFAKQAVQVFKPKIDNRYSADHVASHNKSLVPSTVIERAAEIMHYLREDTKVVGIDEAQFFDEELVSIATELADRGIRVIIAGLDTNWKGEPFQPMPALMAVAESVKKLQAVAWFAETPLRARNV